MKFIIVPTYINPMPNDMEKKEIIAWESQIKQLLENNNAPIIILGDLNRDGMKIMKNIGS